MILITGATGFLGRNVCEHMVSRGIPVRALVRRQSDYAFLEELGVELAWGDVRKKEGLVEAMRGCESVVHAAAKFRFWGEWEDFYTTNVVGTRNMLETACQVGVRRFLYVSTFVVVGRPLPGQIITEDYPCTPLDYYMRTKLEAESTALRYYQEKGLPVMVMRPGALYGPWGRYALNRLFFEDFLRGLHVRVHHGKHLTSPVFVKDVARAIEACLEKGQLGEIYNVSGQSISHQEATVVISHLSGKRDWWVNAPELLMVGVAKIWTFLAHFTKREPFYPITLYPYVFYDWLVSSEKARRELDFQPTPFKEGARQTLEWYRTIGLGNGVKEPVSEVKEEWEKT